MCTSTSLVCTIHYLYEKWLHWTAKAIITAMQIRRFFSFFFFGDAKIIFYDRIIRLERIAIGTTYTYVTHRNVTKPIYLRIYLFIFIYNLSMWLWKDTREPERWSPTPAAYPRGGVWDGWIAAPNLGIF